MSQTPQQLLEQGFQLLNSGQFQPALELFAQVLQQHPNAVEAYSGRAQAFANMGMWMEALDAVINAAGYGNYRLEEMDLFLRILEASQLGSYLPPIEKMLKLALNSVWIEGKASRMLVTQFLTKHAERLNNQDGPFDEVLAPMLKDDTLTMLVERMTIPNYVVEKALLKGRDNLLDKAASGEDIKPFWPFLAALACQQLLNDGLYPCYDADREKLDTLATDDKNQQVTALLLELCYAPFSKAMQIWDEHQALLRSTAPTNLVADLTHYHTIVSSQDRGTVTNETSKTVQSFYMKNPYPKWKMISLNPVTLDQILETANCSIEGNKIKALIAGCGTGMQAVEMALSNPEVPITAIDLSPTSLAFAKSMAQRYGVNNIRFELLDILDVASLGEKYNYIMSTGVLHHMAKPEDGLAALSEVLEDDGAMLLGFYSRMARSDLRDIRDEICDYAGVDADNITDQAISRWRNELSMEQLARPWFDTADFFNLNGMMDALFHPQQHEYTLMAMQRMLSANKLSFRLMTIPNIQKQRYKDALAENAMIDETLMGWHSFEMANPKFFEGMYNFLVTRQKAA